jgi:hypothetical protein
MRFGMIPTHQPPFIDKHFINVIMSHILELLRALHDRGFEVVEPPRHASGAEMPLADLPRGKRTIQSPPSRSVLGLGP